MNSFWYGSNTSFDDSLSVMLLRKVTHAQWSEMEQN